jgi:hypothetical protein
VPKYQNKFRSPTFVETTILDGNGVTVGTLRLKPSSVNWKPKSGQKFYSVSLTDFEKWITCPKTKAKKLKS